MIADQVEMERQKQRLALRPPAQEHIAAESLSQASDALDLSITSFDQPMATKDAKDNDTFTFRSVWGSGGGTLAFADGDTYWLECEGWWRPVWQLIAEHGQTLLRLHAREKSVELPSTVSVPGSRLALLIMFTWYRVLQAEEEAMIAAIAAS